MTLRSAYFLIRLGPVRCESTESVRGARLTHLGLAVEIMDDFGDLFDNPSH